MTPLFKHSHSQNFSTLFLFQRESSNFKNLYNCFHIQNMMPYAGFVDIFNPKLSFS